jgi:UPF0755 protein
MSLRGGGRPRDPGHARPYEPAEQPWTQNPEPPAYRRMRGGRGRGGGLPGVLRFVLFTATLAAIVLLVAFTVLRPVVRSAIVDWAWDNPGSLRIGFVQEMVREDLGAALTSPASDDTTPVEFTVRPGDTLATLAPRLAAAGVITNEQAFLFEATLADLTPDLVAGEFLLSLDMTPEEVVGGLVENPIEIETVDVTFREGLRLEQMTALLQTLPTGVDPQAFYDIATHPPADLLADYAWLDLPEGASLEGYLYPATYPLVVSSTSPATPVTEADDLVRMLLDQFVRVVGTARMAVPEERGLTFHQIVSLASIVEREAVLHEERPIIAGVYQNRLDGLNRTQLLEADPTVFFAFDTMELAAQPFDAWQQYVFWAPPGVPLREIAVPDELAGYQTYVNPGLIPGPIASPRLESIDAALTPNQEEGFLFFVAIPEGGGAHDFSKTFAEHEQKLREYGYTGP